MGFRRSAGTGGRSVLTALFSVSFFWGVSCAAGHDAVTEEIDGTGPPRPPGVAVDPPFELPEPAPSASADDGLVVLVEPTDTRPARHTVDDFFTAVTREDGDALERLLDKSARTHTGARSRTDALSAWRRRFERADFTALASEVVYRPSEVEVHTASDVRALRNERSFPVVPERDQVLVRVPIVSGNPSRLLGNEVFLLLKPGSGGYKIQELFEESRLP